MTESPLLDVRNLAVSFSMPDGLVEAVRGVSFTIQRGKTLAIVGESGSGKSVATQTMIGLTRGAPMKTLAAICMALHKSSPSCMPLSARQAVTC